MNLLQRLYGAFKTNTPDAFAVSSGGQRVVDPALLLNAQRFYAGLRREDKIKLYYSIYHSQPLATGSVNVLVKMCNSRPVFKSGNPQVDARCKEVWKEIDGHTVNSQLMRQGLIYGYAIGEWVSEDMLRIERVVVPDSPLIRFVPNQFGVIEYVQQLQGTLFAPLDPRGRIPAAKCVVYRRDPESSFDYYGASLFESAVGQLESLCQILNAQISVYMRLGKPRFHVQVDNTGLTPEQFMSRLNLVKNHFESLSSADSTDVYTPPGCEIKIIGAESFGQRFADETRLVIQSILAAVGIPPALLHVVTQASGGAESWVRQSVISLQSILDNIQLSLATAWNRSFWNIVQRLEGMPTTPVMEFEAPRLLEALQEEKARESQWNNDLREVLFGIRPPEWLAQRCESPEVFDPSALEQMISTARQSYSPVKDSPSEQTNIAESSKYTDEKASGNATG